MYSVLLKSEIRSEPPQASVERPEQGKLQPVWPTVEPMPRELAQ
jgi:hypothetical protein